MVRRSVRSLFALAAVPIWIACGGGDSAAPEPETGLDAPDRSVDVQTTPVFTVGGFNAPDWAAFGNVRQVAFDDRGHLFILDTQANQVTEVDAEGQFVRTIGGPGEGPGELSSPFGFALTDDGGLAIFDIGHQGWVTYDASGEFMGNVRVDMGTIGLPGNRLSRHPDGGVVGAVGGRIRMGGPGAADSEPEAPSRPVVYFALSEEDSSRVVYDAWDMPEPPEGEEANLSTGGGGSFQIRMPVLRAFEPELRAGALPDGRIAVVDSIGYRIKLVDDGGSVVDVLERPIAPIEVTGGIEEAERERRIAELEADAGGSTTVVAIGGGGMTTNTVGGGMSDMMRNRVESMIFADEIPVIEDMAVDPLGRIWVQRSGDTPGEAGPTDLITADGRYLGSIPADGLRIPQAFGPDGLIVRREVDEFDVPTLIVERLPAEIG
ncbi:MAG: 6-bladed beta-propeller [Gemmatimonadetes bacterium]|nr:6-bladed beta-propeller [Gemmatimonadota bacterium]